MAERFGPGDRVRVRAVDPAGHSRAPQYVRGHRGTVVEVHGHHPLPDDVVAGTGPATQPVYAVRFGSGDLWGEGAHSVTVNLWERYLEAAP
ncbi:MAG: nitrile hydratase subunit beta [Pseudonocardiaceae bacterium]|nr:nitrile hydratase subunit beta [Pseudonocardiaceae bacterium]